MVLADLLLLALLAQNTPAVSPAEQVSRALAPLTMYAGGWLITRSPKLGEARTSDHVANHCHMVDAFYTCEQVLNGKPVALLVFVAGEKAGSYYTQVVLPNGRAEGRSDLTIKGDHWTFSGSDDAGKPSSRVENFFKDRDHIHFEQFKADESGAWIKAGEGDEVRMPGRTK